MLKKILKFRERKHLGRKTKRAAGKLVSANGNVPVTREDGFINWVPPKLANAA